MTYQADAWRSGHMRARHLQEVILPRPTERKMAQFLAFLEPVDPTGSPLSPL